MVDKHLKLKSIATALFRFEKTQDNEKEFLDESRLAEFESKVAVAEANIISVIGFDFDVEIPNQSLYRLADLHFKDNIELLALAKVIQLDLFRVGASLFYPACVTSLAALLLSNYLLSGEVTRTPAARGLRRSERRRPGRRLRRPQTAGRRRRVGRPGGQAPRSPACLHVRPVRLRPTVGAAVPEPTFQGLRAVHDRTGRGRRPPSVDLRRRASRRR